MLATAVPTIGKLDARRVKASKETLGADNSLLDAVLAANTADATGSDDTQAGGRRRKA